MRQPAQVRLTELLAHVEITNLTDGQILQPAFAVLGSTTTNRL